MANLLLVEDDDLLRDGLGDLLIQAGHTVQTAASAQKALELIDSAAFEGIVLDLGLPDMDGMEVLRLTKQRLQAMPVLILTARDDLQDRIAGLQHGADDYMTKPFEADELLVRIIAMLRRAQLPAFTGSSLDIKHQGRTLLKLDPQRNKAWLQDTLMDLTQREWTLLYILVRQIGQVVGREDAALAWQSDPDEGAMGMHSNALEVYVHRLRRKLGDSGLTIRNVRGLGYMLETPS